MLLAKLTSGGPMLAGGRHVATVRPQAAPSVVTSPAKGASVLLVVGFALCAAACGNDSASGTRSAKIEATVPSTSSAPVSGVSASSTTGGTLQPHPDHDPDVFKADVTPAAGPPGTPISVTTGLCPRSGDVTIQFRDRRVVDSGVSAPGKPLPVEWIGTTLKAMYVIAEDDEKGIAVIRISCAGETGSQLHGH